MNLLSMGTRLSISSQLCTVLYIGPLEDTTGSWLGVEWDSPERGKHSGSHNGVQYFSCRYSPFCGVLCVWWMLDSVDGRVPGAGSFIRPGKKTDGERTFLEALRGKYAGEHEEYEPLILDSSGKEIQRIGFDKIEREQRYSLNQLLTIVISPNSRWWCWILVSFESLMRWRRLNGLVRGLRNLI
jgi:tubulin-specific chaperone E